MDPGAESSLGWVKPYYTTAGEYWGPPGVEKIHLDRLAILERFCGSSPLRVLELGAGYGEAASVMADAGHSVVALEFSPTRIPHIQELARRQHVGRLTALEADFYAVDLPKEFDAVCYWDGFGVGSDSDQRRLLRTIASEWVKPEGVVLIDVFNPYRWTVESGKEWALNRNHESHRYHQRRRFNFDPIHGCFLDTWCPIDDTTGEPNEQMAITQKVRCYNPADFKLLLEGTGLELELAEVAGVPVDFTSAGSDRSHPIWNAWSYLVKLSVVGTPN